jgi:hypothetical protein
MCGFDMGTKRLLWSGTVHDYGKRSRSVILPRNFFASCNPRSQETRKSNLPSETELPRKASRSRGVLVVPPVVQYTASHELVHTTESVHQLLLS